jgi:hypothetical protein
MEMELGPGSRLVEPRVQELVRQMSDRLAQVKALALEAEECCTNSSSVDGCRLERLRDDDIQDGDPL